MRLRQRIFDAVKRFALELLADPDVLRVAERGVVAASASAFTDLAAAHSRAIQENGALAQKYLGDLASAHAAAGQAITHISTSVQAATERAIADISNSGYAHLLKTNEDLTQRLQAARQELSQCVQDLSYISSTGHHSEYANRRVRQVLEKLERL